MSSTFQVYIHICLNQVTQLLLGQMLLFMFTMSDIAGGQQQGIMDAYNNRLEASHDGRVRLYRELQLLTDEYHNLLALYHAIMHATVVSLLTLCVYIFVRTEGLMAALAAYMGIWGLPCYCVVMNNYAEIQISSSAFLESLKKSGSVRVSSDWIRTRRPGASAAIIRRELRSLRELRIKGGSCAFYFDKELVLTVTDTTVYELIGLLLMT